MILTPTAKAIARLALGLPNPTRTSIRNEMFIPEGSPDLLCWRILEAAAFARSQPAADGTIFRLTDDGAMHALEDNEALGRDFPDARYPVFVYGTLKMGYGNYRARMHTAQYIGDAVTVNRYLLMQCGFPIAFPVQEGGLCVSGELYLIDSGTLASLDALEGVGHGMYRRVWTAVVVDQRLYDAFIYVAGDTMQSFDLSPCPIVNGTYVWRGSFR